jgi:hypothetical protein
MSVNTRNKAMERFLVCGGFLKVVVGEPQKHFDGIAEIFNRLFHMRR